MARRSNPPEGTDGRRPSPAAAAPAKAQRTFEKLRAAYPDAHCELDHVDPFQLLVATVLSAQSTDVAVNRVTPNLFRRWPNAASMATADLDELQAAIGSIGMFRQKARHLVGLSNRLVEQHNGQVPRRLDALVALPGVGRKTANVVLGVAFGAPEGVVVDTHVQRLSQRLGWTKATEPGPIESELMRLFARKDWDLLSHTLIFHGRRCCTARSPACAACPVASECSSAFRAETIGRKASASLRANAVARTPGKSTLQTTARTKNAPTKNALSQAAAGNIEAHTRTASAPRSKPLPGTATVPKKKSR